MKTCIETVTQHTVADTIAGFAWEALLEEVYLTPKPGLVDLENNGSHHDLSLSLMESSALALRPAFYDMAVAADGKTPSQPVREQLAAIGRYGEQQMRQATGNINTHKGAIWCIGLLSAATSMLLSGNKKFSQNDLLKTAGRIAAFEDRYQPKQNTNGLRVSKKYRVVGAREEAVLGFPTLYQTALPAWDYYKNEPEEIRRLNVLVALMAVVDDTCILYRADMKTLKTVQRMAKAIIDQGGLGMERNRNLYLALAGFTHKKWVSPGGSADLLSASIFLHKITHHFKINSHGNILI